MLRHLGKLACAVVLTVTGLALTPAPADATITPGPRPAFQLPFPCNTYYRVNTWDHSPSVDIVREPQSATAGTPVLASAAGVVKEAGYHTYAGNYVLISHGGYWYTVYIHLQSTPLVRAGQSVARGTRIGAIGHTGLGSNNTDHLHYEQLVDWNADGHVAWGVDASQDGTSYNGEDVAVTFNGATYTGDGREWRNVKSVNACTPTTPSKYWVDTFANAPGYASPTSTTRTGTLYAGTSYVYCKVWGREVRDAYGNYNHWWLRTDLDSGSPWQNQYVSAYYLSRWGNDEAKDNNGVVIRTC